MTMSALGQKQTYAPQQVMSGLRPKADMCGATRDVRFGPKADIEPFYSINVIGFFPQVKNARRILGRLSADADAC
jgi:hypothetical protein